jgi:hypothetical protein
LTEGLKPIYLNSFKVKESEERRGRRVTIVRGNNRRGKE